MPDYMQEFDDNFEFENLPSEKTPKSAENLNVSIKNVRLLKKLIEDVITGNLDIVVKSIKSVNLFDSERWYTELRAVREASMEKVTVDGKSYFKVHPSLVENYEFMKGEFKANTQYTIKYKGRHFNEEAQGKVAGFTIVYTDGTLKYYYTNNTILEEDYTITTEPNKTISCLRICHNYNGYVLFRNIMMYEGTEDREYSPHQF